MSARKLKPVQNAFLAGLGIVEYETPPASAVVVLTIEHDDHCDRPDGGPCTCTSAVEHAHKGARRP